MLTRAIFRALCALLVGFLLVSNPTDMTVLLVQIIGGLFTLSGLLAIIGYFTNRARESGFRPMFPIVGAGSLAFGILLLIWPMLFVNILMYVLGVLLALIGIGQIVSLISYRKFSPITWSLFVLPLLFIATGILVIIYPMEAAALPFTILGVGYLFYGVSEFLLGIRFYRFRRLFDAAEAQQQAETEIHDADIIDVTDTPATAANS